MKKNKCHEDTGIGDIQKVLVSEYFVINCAHSCTTWAISTRTSFVALIFDEALFSRTNSYVRSIVMTRPLTDGSRLACDSISYPDSR